MPSLARVLVASLVPFGSGGLPLLLEPILDAVREHAGDFTVRQLGPEGRQGSKGRATSQTRSRKIGDPEKGSVEMSMPALMEHEEGALKASAKALGQYKSASADLQTFMQEKEAAEKRQQKAARAESDAAAKLQEAMGGRVKAAELDMQSDPLTNRRDKARKTLDAAVAKVGASEKVWRDATKVANSMDSEVDKAEAKVEKALEEQAEYEVEVKETRSEAHRLAGAVDREERRIETAVASLRKQEDTVSVAMETAMREGAKSKQASPTRAMAPLASDEGKQRVKNEYMTKTLGTDNDTALARKAAQADVAARRVGMSAKSGDAAAEYAVSFAAKMLHRSHSFDLPSGATVVRMS